MASKKISGKLFKIPKKDVDTDQIIPARYLTKPTTKGLAPHCMEGLEFESFDRASNEFKQGDVLVVGENFGCGSSREHAVWAIASHGVKAIIGITFARIFRQNAIACGLPIIELKQNEVEKLFKMSNGIEVKIDLTDGTVSAEDSSFHFKLNEFDKDVLQAGGLVLFANKRYG